MDNYFRDVLTEKVFLTKPNRRVYLARAKLNDPSLPTYFVIKSFHERFMPTEIEVHKGLQKLDESILKIHDSWFDGKAYHMAIEYCEDGDLHTWLTQLNGSDIGFQCILHIAWQLSRTVKIMHSRSICHRDIKPLNIYMKNERSIYKLADFGEAKIVKSNDFSYHTITGTPFYMSPEQMQNFKLRTNVKVNPYRDDIWALGRTLIELSLCRLCPETLGMDIQQLHSFISTQLGSLGFPDRYCALIKTMMADNPDILINANQVEDEVSGMYKTWYLPPSYYNPQDHYSEPLRSDSQTEHLSQSIVPGSENQSSSSNGLNIVAKSQNADPGSFLHPPQPPNLMIDPADGSKNNTMIVDKKDLIISSNSEGSDSEDSSSENSSGSDLDDKYISANKKIEKITISRNELTENNKIPLQVNPAPHFSSAAHNSPDKVSPIKPVQDIINARLCSEVSIPTDRTNDAKNYSFGSPSKNNSLNSEEISKIPQSQNLIKNDTKSPVLNAPNNIYKSPQNPSQNQNLGLSPPLQLPNHRSISSPPNPLPDKYSAKDPASPNKPFLNNTPNQNLNKNRQVPALKIPNGQNLSRSFIEPKMENKLIEDYKISEIPEEKSDYGSTVKNIVKPLVEECIKCKFCDRLATNESIEIPCGHKFHFTCFKDKYEKEFKKLEKKSKEQSCVVCYKDISYFFFIDKCSFLSDAVKKNLQLQVYSLTKAYCPEDRTYLNTCMLSSKFKAKTRRCEICQGKYCTFCNVRGGHRFFCDMLSDFKKGKLIPSKYININNRK